MNNHDQYLLCLERAKAIVAAHRAEVPEGFDPQGTWVALGVAVVGEGVQDAQGKGLFIHDKADAAKKAATQGNMSSKNTLKPTEFERMPAYVPADVRGLDRDVTRQDQIGYNRSDLDFLRRHPELRGGEKQFEHLTAQDQFGDSRFMPQLQSEAVNAGLGLTLDAFGDQGPILARGSAGEARVAQNLGTSIIGFQDRNRQNAERSLSLAEQIFPRRTIGLSGSDIGKIELGNLSARNAWNQANYASKVGQQQFNQSIAAGNQANAISQANANAQAAATLGASQAQMYSSLASTAVQAGGNAYGSYQAAHPVSPTPTTTSVTARG